MIKYFLEIKNRVLLLTITLFFIILTSYLHKETLLFLITQPDELILKKVSHPSNFYFMFTNVTEVFSVYMELINFLGIQFFLLFIAYHCFVFLSPAMFKFEYCCFIFILKGIIAAWFLSILLCHFILVPVSWDFFFSFQQMFSYEFINLHFEAKLSEYLKFYKLIYYSCYTYVQVFAIVFVFFNYVNNKIKMIRKFRKIYYYFFFIISTLLTPPDLLSQLIVSLLFILIYEILIFVVIVKLMLIRQPVKTNKNTNCKN